MICILLTRRQQPSRASFSRVPAQSLTQARHQISGLLRTRQVNCSHSPESQSSRTRDAAGYIGRPTGHSGSCRATQESAERAGGQPGGGILGGAGSDACLLQKAGMQESVPNHAPLARAGPEALEGVRIYGQGARHRGRDSWRPPCSRGRRSFEFGGSFPRPARSPG